jgi:riboflavin kinase / FMN adenylyltransferase
MILLHSLDDIPQIVRGGAVAIGNFDGVHLGHARLVGRLHAMAAAIAGPAVVFTFDPPPTRILRPDAAPEPLVWIERKVELLAELGVDAVWVYPTDRALLEMEAREFFDRMVRRRLDARAMVEGPNFFFGRRRSGNVDVLRQFCAEAGMPFEAAGPIEVGGQMVSSSRIREAIMAGQVEEARAMLGRPHRIRGVAIHGSGRGAAIGFPTANLEGIDTLLPAEGIYAARAYIRPTPCAVADGTRSVPATIICPAAVNIGPNPTFGEGRLKIEAHLVGFQGDLYDRPMEIDFLARLREIKRFPSVDALLVQIAADVARTVELTKK